MAAVEAILSMVGVIAGAVLGGIGGYLTARQQGRQAIELERLKAAEERRRQTSELAVEIATAEVSRNPGNPYQVAEHAAVLTFLLNRHADGLMSDPASVDSFRVAYLSACASHGLPDTTKSSLGQHLLWDGISALSVSDLLHSDAQAPSAQTGPTGPTIDIDAEGTVPKGQVDQARTEPPR